MIVEQMSAADLLREGKQAMTLAMGSVGPDTRARWEAVMAEIDLRLSVGDLDEDDLEGRVKAIAKQRDEAIAERDHLSDLVDVTNEKLARVDRRRAQAEGKIINNSDNLQFVQDAFNANHPALKGQLGVDLSHGAKLLWAWAQESYLAVVRDFPLFDEDGLDQVEHCCEWSLNQDRKRLHDWLKENGHV